jgi:hypothetical protein
MPIRPKSRALYGSSPAEDNFLASSPAGDEAALIVRERAVSAAFGVDSSEQPLAGLRSVRPPISVPEEAADRIDEGPDAELAGHFAQNRDDPSATMASRGHSAAERSQRSRQSSGDDASREAAHPARLAGGQEANDAATGAVARVILQDRSTERDPRSDKPDTDLRSVSREAILATPVQDTKTFAGDAALEVPAQRMAEAETSLAIDEAADGRWAPAEPGHAILRGHAIERSRRSEKPDHDLGIASDPSRAATPATPVQTTTTLSNEPIPVPLAQRPIQPEAPLIIDDRGDGRTSADLAVSAHSAVINGEQDHESGGGVRSAMRMRGAPNPIGPTGAAAASDRSVVDSASPNSPHSERPLLQLEAHSVEERAVQLGRSPHRADRARAVTAINETEPRRGPVSSPLAADTSRSGHVRSSEGILGRAAPAVERPALANRRDQQWTRAEEVLRPRVQVNIGRIEIREPHSPRALPTRRRTVPKLGLSAYLDRRFGGDRNE